LIAHRDIKPSNLIITKDEKIKVLDFGIAKILGNESYKLTKTGAHTGTVYYMSPEQVRGQEVDAKSDIYSLGITLYQMLTGYNPYFDLTTEYEIFEKIVKIPLADPRIIYPAVSEHMCKVIAKATQKNPSDRFKSCDEFALGLIDENSFNLNASSDDSIAKPTDNTTTTNIKIPDQAKKKKPLFFIVTILLIILVMKVMLRQSTYQKNNQS
jgi:serine/threonine protein kinase